MTTEPQRIIEIMGRAVPLREDNVDTDRITPAVALMEPTFDNMAAYLFRDARKSDPRHPLNDPKYQGATLLVVGKNFGSGSSRESAPQAITRAGFRALIGESFAEIFAGNCNVLGIPAVVASHEAIALLFAAAERRPETLYRLNLETKTLTFEADGGMQRLAIDLAEPRRVALLSGSWNSLAMLQANEARVRQVAAALPYMNEFR
ncbi:MAG: isopropylmalate isomerase [Candidatus Tectomicrobia bacterium]|nr:isopropylmalate isomerase [Candidatus Tectomicrobia bacterium]